MKTYMYEYCNIVTVASNFYLFEFKQRQFQFYTIII